MDELICNTCDMALPNLAGINFCPFCGSPVEFDVEEILDNAENHEHEEAFVDESIDSKNIEDNNKEVAFDNITKEEIMEKQKVFRENQDAVRAKYANMKKQSVLREHALEDIYTLILKGCDNKEVLIDCLNQVLLRGETAIRLAVTTMPAVLLYKSSKETVEHVVDVLKDMDAVYAVVEGNFDYSSFYKSNAFLELDPASRTILKNLPKTMWLGENIKFISSDMTLEDVKGFAVLGNNAFFFLPLDENESKIFLPMYKFENIYTWEQNSKYNAEWLTTDGRIYQMSFAKYEDYEKLSQIFDEY